MRTNAVKKITEGFVALLCAAAWLTFFISRSRWNSKGAADRRHRSSGSLRKAQRGTNEQRFTRVQEADRGMGGRPRRRKTDGESFDSLQAAVRARLPDRRNRFRYRPAVRSGNQKGKNTLVILMK